MNIRQMLGLRKAANCAEIGIEIEMEGPGVSEVSVRNKWSAKTDGSLRGESVEWVMPRPVGRNTVHERLSALTKAAKICGARFQPSDRCGVHVHVNVQELTLDEVFKFITTYFILEPVLIRWCGEDREGNLFCLRGSDAEYLIRQLARVKEKHVTLIEIMSDELRYAALNVTSLPKYGSLEFRAMQTPEDLMVIETWVKVLLAIKDWSIHQPDCASIIEGMSGMGWVEFARRVLGEELFAQFNNPDIERQLVEGMRLAQIIAYAEPARPQNEALNHIALDEDDVEDPVGDAVPDGININDIDRLYRDLEFNRAPR